MSVVRYWIWLAELFGAGSAKYRALLAHFGSAESLYFAQRAELEAVPGISRREIQKLGDKSLARAEAVLEECDRRGIRVMTMQDAEYPQRLNSIAAPPAVLYIRGELPRFDEEPTLAVVGTRDASVYGLRAAESMTYEFAKCGGLTVTGLARGCDSAAARGALRAGGRVVGVLGCGVDVVYPRENRSLFEQVLERGALISEFCPGSKAEGRNFPVRNRVLSGLADGVLVAEAPRSSGALITAEYAAEQGRDVFTVPASVDAVKSRGSNQLLRDGAIPVMSGLDIVDEYIARYPDKLTVVRRYGLEDTLKRIWNSSPEEPRKTKTDKKPASAAKKVIDKQTDGEYIDLKERLAELEGDELTVARVLERGPRHVDDVIDLSGIGAPAALAALTMLEIRGIVVQKNGRRFELK